MIGIPDTYVPDPTAADPNAPDFTPLTQLAGYQEPVQGFPEHLAVALQGGIPALPSTQRPGDIGPSWLASLLTGAARGAANVGAQRISERESFNKALGQAQHEKNALAIEQSKEGRKARTVTAEMAQQRGWPAEYVGQQIGDLPKEATSAPAAPKEKEAANVTMGDVLSSNGTLNMGDIGTSWNDAGIKTRVMGKQPEKPLPAYMTVLKEGDKNALAAQFRAGQLDPGMLNLSGRGIAAPILAILAKPGPNGEPPWNQAKAKLQWDAMRALTRNANGSQILNLQRAAGSVQSATALLEDLNKQLTEAVRRAPIPRSEIPESNRISLAAAQRGVYGPDALRIARQFDTQIGVLRTEYPSVLSGGWSPQAAQISEAERMLSPIYGEGGVQAALSILKQDAAYKIAAVNGVGANTPGIEGENPYGAAPQYQPQQPFFAPGGGLMPPPGAPPAVPPPAPAPAAPAVPKARYQNARGTVQFDFEPGKAPKSWTLVRTTVKAHTRAVGGSGGGP